MKYLLSICTILLPLFAQGQTTYFNERFDFFDGPDVGFSGVETDFGYLIIAGAYDSLRNQGPGILRLGISGEVESKDVFSKPHYSFYAGRSGSLVKTRTGGYALFGGMLDTTGHNYAVLYFMDSLARIIDFKSYSSSEWNTGTQVKSTEDGGFILIGRSKIVDILGDFWLIKTDSLGEMEWEQTYGGDDFEYGLSVDLCKDGGYILVGESKSFGTPAVTWHGSNILVIKTDSLGHEQWQRVFGNEYGDVVWNVEQTSDGGYIVGGALGDSLAGPYYLRKPYLIKLDSLGHTEWERTYLISGQSTLFRMVRELPDGSFIAAGQYKDTTGWPSGLVMKVAANGDSLWVRFPENLKGLHSFNYLYDIRSTSDGGFICTGELFPNNPDTLSSPTTNYPQDLWVLKLDSLGCSEPGCNEVTTSIPPQPIPGISIYPNPFQNLVQIEAKTPEELRIEMIDLRGRIIHRETFQNQTTLSLDDLPAGIYPYRVRDKQGRQSQGKLIKE